MARHRIYSLKIIIILALLVRCLMLELLGGEAL